MQEEISKEFKEAYNYCIFLLSKRDYSRYKIQQKLKSRKCDTEIIEDVIEKLVNQNYLREEAYIRMRIKTLLLKGFANYYIIQKLNEEKLQISDEQINKLREENHLSTKDSLEYLLNKKLRGKEIPKDFEAKMKLQNKILRFLISKGHNFQSAKEAFNQFIQEN
jgi:regulatory protein